MYIYIYIYIYIKILLLVQREYKNISKSISPRRELYLLEFIFFLFYIRVYFQLVAFVR